MNPRQIVRFALDAEATNSPEFLAIEQAYPMQLRADLRQELFKAVQDCAFCTLVEASPYLTTERAMMVAKALEVADYLDEDGQLEKAGWLRAWAHGHRAAPPRPPGRRNTRRHICFLAGVLELICQRAGHSAPGTYEDGETVLESSGYARSLNQSMVFIVEYLLPHAERYERGKPAQGARRVRFFTQEERQLFLLSGDALIHVIRQRYKLAVLPGERAKQIYREVTAETPHA